MALTVVLTVITTVALAVGVLGVARIAKDRPALKSYEQRTGSDISKMAKDMRCRDAQNTRMPLKTEPRETDAESHMRAHDGEANKDDAPLLMRMLRQVAMLLLQLTGISLLTGFITDDKKSATMGNSNKPTITVRSAGVDSSASALSAEVESLRDKKTTQPPPADEQPQEGDVSEDSALESEEEEELMDTISQQEDELRSQIMLDGLQFYAAVASLSVSTANNVVDIGLFRATTIVLRERRKALEEQTILAIEEQYPDIMCLPPNANVQYAGPRKSHADAGASAIKARATVSSSRDLEARFLTAA